jgi:hypothetical protein
MNQDDNYFKYSLDRAKQKIANDTATKMAAIDSMPVDGAAPASAPGSAAASGSSDAPAPGSATIENEATASAAPKAPMVSRAADMANNTLQGWAGKMAGLDQLARGGYGLAANTGMVTPDRRYEPASTADNVIRTAVGAGSFIPGVAQFARPVAVGMTAADLIPESVYKWGLDKLGQLPNSGVQVNLGGKTPEQVIAEHSSNRVHSTNQAQLTPPTRTSQSAPVYVSPDNQQTSFDESDIPAPGTGWITNNSTGKTTMISAQPQPQMSHQRIVANPSTPQLSSPTMPSLNTSGGIMSAMAGFVNQAGNAANQIAANNTANRMFKNQLASEQQANANTQQANANTKANAEMNLLNTQGQSANIDLAQKQRIDDLQKEYLNADPDRQSKIAREIMLYTGKSPTRRNYERVRTVTRDQAGNPVPVDYLYDTDSGRWLTPPPSQDQQQPIKDGIRIDPVTGKAMKVVNGEATLLN